MSATSSCAVSPATEAPRELAPRQEPHPGPWLTVVAGLAAALPVIVTGIRAIAGAWLPAADQGIIATRAYDVFTSHSPLVGQFSMASTLTGHATYDLGPTLYWLLALPARFGGAPALTATMSAFNTALIVCSVALARRRGGVGLMLASALAIALMSHSFGAEALHGIWNPSAGLFALTLLCFLCWSVACDEPRLLPGAVLAASFAMQCHLAYVAPALGLLAVALAGLLVARARWRRARSRRDDPEAPERSLRRPVAVALVLAALCWWPAIVNELSSSRGNLSALSSAASAHQKTEGGSAAWHALSAAIGIPPRWLRSPQRQALSPRGEPVGQLSGGDYGDTRVGDVWGSPGLLRALSCLLALCALLAIVLVGARRRRSDVVAGAACALVLCAAFAWVTSATPVADVDTLGYSLWWGSVLGMWVWLMIGWSLATLARTEHGALRRRPSLWRARVPGGLRPAVLGLALVVACGAAIAALEPADAHESEFAPLRAIDASLASNVPRGSTVLLIQHGAAPVPLEPTVKYMLRRREIRALGYLAGRRLGSWYELGSAPYGLVIDLAEGSAPAGAPVLRRVSVTATPWLPGAGRRSVISVTLARG